MDKKNFSISAIAGVIIGLLTIPTINNLPLPEALADLGAVKVAIILGLLSVVGYIVAELLAKILPIFRQIGRFAIVGVLNTVLDFAILNALISVSGVAEGSLVIAFKGIAFIIAVTNSYYWNKYWAFEFKGKVSQEILQFFAVSTVGFGLNVGAFAIIVNVIGPVGNIPPEAWANVGALAGTFAGLAWNFVGYKFIVFKKKDV